MSNNLTVKETPIHGMYLVDLELHKDNRGWFKENYQSEKMEKLGLPHFEIVQNNISFNAYVGITRGLHAEPWEKYISVASGSIFAAWIDLRKGNGFGKVYTMEITPSIAVFIPRGVANGYQSLEENMTYSYLVNDHWSNEKKYISVNLFDPDLNISWPIGKDQAIVSNKDKLNPLFKDVEATDF